MKRVRGYYGDLILKIAKKHNSEINNVNQIGDLVALWWVVADSPVAKISRPLKNCSPIFYPRK
jgi:hypothetical protein